MQINMTTFGGRKRHYVHETPYNTMPVVVRHIGQVSSFHSPSLPAHRSREGKAEKISADRNAVFDQRADNAAAPLPNRSEEGHRTRGGRGQPSGMLLSTDVPIRGLGHP